MFIERENKLIFRFDAEELWIEPWGTNSFRVRASPIRPMPLDDWALQHPTETSTQKATIQIKDDHATITNGKITARVSRLGKLIISNAEGKVLLEEYSRHRLDVLDPKCSALEIKAREFKGLQGGDFHLKYSIESQDRNEKIYGMGQYQQPYLNLKGLDLELAHRNSQASVPFMLSSLGYGLLWNNPSIGRAVLGGNVMSFEASETKVLDYWIVAGDSPAEITQAYGKATGTAPMMPEYGLGFWQSKLRYQDADEVLEVARGHKERGLPLDVIVIDFFHWPKQGDWRFDETYWPDPGELSHQKSLSISLLTDFRRCYGEEAQRHGR